MMISVLSFNRDKIIDLLIKGTLYKRLKWARVSDFLFYNRSNNALVNFVEVFSRSDKPQTIDDSPQVDIMSSYYCEYEGVAFCLMHFTQVFETDNPARQFYYLMVQRHPYDNFGYYTTPEESESLLIKELVADVELQISISWADSTPFDSAMTKLHSDILSINPIVEKRIEPLPPSPPHKHCCVIDKNNNYVEFVLVYLEADEDGVTHENIQYYALKPGERLIDTIPPADRSKTHWNGSDWE